MALSNLAEFNLAGTGCGAGDQPAEKPSACGASDKPDEKPDEKPEEKPSACGASDK